MEKNQNFGDVKGYLLKIIRIMRLSLFLIIVSTAMSFSANSYSQNAKLSLELKNATIREVIQVIESQSEFIFFYQTKQVDLDRQVSISATGKEIESVLDQVFAGTDNVYVVNERQIVIGKTPMKELKKNEAILEARNLSVNNQAQQRLITGKITDEGGLPLPGVSVIVKGTTIGTVTNTNGEFSLDLPLDALILQFSFVGMQSQEVVIGTQTMINLSMIAETVGIDEVVAVGYGIQKKTSVTASISTMKGDELNETPIPDLSNGMGGRVSGVIVKQTTGEPGKDGASIFIRGISSTGTTQPLIIVDGIPRDFSQLDANTIESFTVLKDAAAVAPYGVAGANGVILVTTKRGEIGAPTLTYNGYTGFQNPTVLPDFVNAYQYATLQNLAAQNEGFPLPYSEYALQKYKDGSDPDAFPDPDYRDLLSKNAVLTNHNLTLSGGNENVKYFASLGYQSQEGMWSKDIPLLEDKTQNKKYTFNINLDAQATRFTKLSFSINGRVQNSAYPSLDPDRVFEEFVWSHPVYGPLFYSNGMNGNYLSSAIVNDGYRKVNTTALYTQISVEQTLPFIPGLSAKATIAYDPTTVMNKHWLTPLHIASIDTTQRPYVITDGIYQQTKSSLEQNFNQSYQLTYQGSLNYAKTFGKNMVSAVAVFEAKANNYQTLGAFRRNFSLGIDEISMGSSSQSDIANSGASTNARQVGVVYRATYNYSGKYMFEASGRYDGSYYFARGNQFGFFPSFSIGWRLSEEKFMKDVEWIDNLKLRASVGEVGALAAQPFQYMSSYDVYGPAYVIGGEAVQAVRGRGEPNLDITWEKARKHDIGIDASFAKGLLSIEIDYFHEKRSNMLVQPDVMVPIEYGIELSQENAGIMKNQGVDFSIGSRYSISQDFQVQLEGNFTYARNSLLQVFETPATFNNPNRRLTGKPLGTHFGYHAIGYFQLSDFNANGELKENIAIQPWGEVKPGDIRYEDINGDGDIDDDDLTVIGDPSTPGIIYGLSPKIFYKGLSLDLLFQGVGKTDIWAGGWLSSAFDNGRTAYVDNFNYWTPENPNAKYPRITSSMTTNNIQSSSLWMRDGSYLRLKSAVLGYEIPAAITEKIKIGSAKIYVSGQNLITWSKTENWDPESYNSSNLYPLQKVVSVGANITF